MLATKRRLDRNDRAEGDDAPAEKASDSRWSRLAHLRVRWKALHKGVLAFFFPPVCVACMRATQDVNALCPACWGQMRWIERPYCECLGTPFALDTGERLLSPAALANPPAYSRARAAVQYEGVARQLVHRLKYHDRMDLVPAMARMMSGAGRDLLAEADLMIPVPLHAGRLRRRRFNQSAALTAALSRLSGVGWDALAMRRTRHTPTQAGLSRRKRAANLRGAFAVPDSRRAGIAGKRVLLVDDVLTTGATAEACARALLRAGAQRVDVLVFALVPAGR